MRAGACGVQRNCSHILQECGNVWVCVLVRRCVCHVSVSAATDTQPRLFPRLIIFPSCQARQWCHNVSERRGKERESRKVEETVSKRCWIITYSVLKVNRRLMTGRHPTNILTSVHTFRLRAGETWDSTNRKSNVDCFLLPFFSLSIPDGWTEYNIIIQWSGTPSPLRLFKSLSTDVQARYQLLQEQQWHNSIFCYKSLLIKLLLCTLEISI